MGYTAIDKLQKNNFDTFGIDPRAETIGGTLSG